MTTQPEYVLVPREPTQAMRDAAIGSVINSSADFADLYRAMLAAAPQPIEPSIYSTPEQNKEGAELLATTLAETVRNLEREVAVKQARIDELSAGDSSAQFAIALAKAGNVTGDTITELYGRPQPASASLPPIDSNESYERDYIPLPGGWEVQTKGKGSTFRLCDTKTGDRLPMGCGGGRLEHDMLERMAREIHAAVSACAVGDADKRDAERYRWIRSKNFGFAHDEVHRGISTSTWGEWVYADEAQLDNIIDAAIAAQRKGGE